MVDGDADPDEEGLVREGAARFELFVEFWIKRGKGFGDVLVEDEGEDGEDGVDCCVADEEPVLAVISTVFLLIEEGWADEGLTR